MVYCGRIDEQDDVSRSYPCYSSEQYNFYVHGHVHFHFVFSFLYYNHSRYSRGRLKGSVLQAQITDSDEPMQSLRCKSRAG